MKKILKDLPHYISLIGIFLAGIFGFVMFSYDKNFQMVIAVAVAGAYVSWAIIHHAVHKDIYWEVVVEYIAISILGLVTVYSLIF